MLLVSEMLACPMASYALDATAISWLSTDPANAIQAACEALASNDLGAVVEACASAVPFLGGWLREWCLSGALALQCTASSRVLHDEMEPAKAACLLCSAAIA